MDLTDIEKRLERIESKCDKMSKHIDFIEYVYTITQKPLNYILGKTYLFGSKKLPSLDIKNNNGENDQLIDTS
jgi:hypothetical protein